MNYCGLLTQLTNKSLITHAILKKYGGINYDYVNISKSLFGICLSMCVYYTKSQKCNGILLLVNVISELWELCSGNRESRERRRTSSLSPFPRPWGKTFNCQFRTELTRPLKHPRAHGPNYWICCWVCCYFAVYSFDVQDFWTNLKSMSNMQRHHTSHTGCSWQMC